MKSSASESEPFQSRFEGEIPGWARQKERLSSSELKQAFLIQILTANFSCTFFNVLGSAHEKFGPNKK